MLLFTLLIKSCVFTLAVPFGSWHPGFEELEGYQDFRLAYVPLVSNFTAGKMPYRDFHYAYPPFFIYLLTPFALTPLPSWFMALPLVAFDIATVILVYLISGKLTSSRRAFIAATVFAVAPINLWYNDFLWLNPPPMTFFTLLAVYMYVLKKYEKSFVFLAIATLFKQIAFLLFPIFLVNFVKAANRREVTKGALLYGTICFLGSLPYIITIPTHYLWHLGVPGFGPGWQGVEYKYYFGSPTNLAIVLGENVYNPAKPLLWTALLISSIVLCWRIYKSVTATSFELINHIVYALLFFHAFFPRGIYKYYFTAITPFISMFIRNRRGVLAFLGLNILILIIPRPFTPWFSILVIILLFAQKRHD